MSVLLASGHSGSCRISIDEDAPLVRNLQIDFGDTYFSFGIVGLSVVKVLLDFVENGKSGQEISICDQSSLICDEGRLILLATIEKLVIRQEIKNRNDFRLALMDIRSELNDREPFQNDN